MIWLSVGLLRFCIGMGCESRFGICVDFLIGMYWVVMEMHSSSFMLIFEFSDKVVYKSCYHVYATGLDV